MAKLLLKYIQAFRDRYGHARYYFRYKGKRLAALPGLSGSKEFMAAYTECLAKIKPETSKDLKPVVEGSFAALAKAYYHSDFFTKGMNADRQKNHRRRVDKFCRLHGHAPVRGFDAPALEKYLGSYAGKPGERNFVLKLMKRFLKYAVKPMRWLPHNPALDVDKIEYKKKPRHTWTKSDVAQFRAGYAVGTRERVAFELLANTGQRGIDATQLKADGDIITFIASKNDAELKLPVTPDLRAAMDACPIKGETILVTEYGKPFKSSKSFQNWFGDICDAIKMPQRCRAHGIRYFLATDIADRGMTAHQIKAVTGTKASLWSRNTRPRLIKSG